MKQAGFRIRPTALWFIFGPVLFCMWLAAVNYSNNLVYAILYLIAALSLVSVFHTWRNLSSLQIEHVRIHPAFAGSDVRMTIYLRNTSKRNVYAVHFYQLGDAAGRGRHHTSLQVAGRGGVRVAADDSYAAEVSFPSESRGLYRFKILQLGTAYPFGLFQASMRLPVNTEYYVYPQPKGRDDWPSPEPGQESSGAPSSQRPGDDFAGVRVYSPGESLRHVDWKAFARGRPLSVKLFAGGSGHEFWFDADRLNWLSLEARLSQLALWVLNAEKAEMPYALRLGRTVLPVGLGEAHARRALEALAVAGAGSA